MSRLSTVASRALAAAALAAGLLAGAALAEPLKVGFVYVGPVGDHGWSHQHDLGRQAVEEAFPDRGETTYVESVTEGADANRVIAELAGSGHGLIFTTSFGYMNPTIEVAGMYPDVRFEHATGYKRARNVATYSARFYEGRHVAGLIAGAMTESDIIGYVASFPIPEVVRGINAAFLAARSVNPDVRFEIVWVSTWYDPAKEADAARTLIDRGADVIMQHTDSPAALRIAEDKGVLAIGQSSDMTVFGPRAHLVSLVDDWGPYYVRRVGAVLDGTWDSTDTWGGFREGMLRLSTYNPDLPPDVVRMAEEARAGIADGSVHPFAGPIRDQQGTLVVADGEVAPDDLLLGMYFYVEGIDASLPQ